MINLIDIFIAGSKTYKKELLKLGVPKNKIKMIYHGIPIEWFKSLAYKKDKVYYVLKKLKLKKQDNLIICPVRLDRKSKLIELFIEAAAALKRELPQFNFIFLVAAKAKNKEEAKYIQHLRNFAKDLGIDNLRFQTFELDKIPALNRLARVSVLPSIAEGLGLVILEALAVKTPVIASNTVGTTEVIKSHRRHGLLFEGQDPEILKNLLYELFTDSDLVNALKKEGYRRLTQKFSATLMVDEYLKIYEELKNKYKK